MSELKGKNEVCCADDCCKDDSKNENCCEPNCCGTPQEKIGGCC